MASILFVDYQTVIPASWLNAVNALVYTGQVPAPTFTLTNLVVNTSVSGSGMTAYMSSPPAIGNTAPNAGYFTGLQGTEITATSKFNGSGAGLSSIPLATAVTGLLAVSNGGLGVSTAPANGAIPIGNGTGYNVSTLTAGAGISVTNSSGAITITNTAASPIPSGSLMLFQQTSAPTGWTKQTSHNNKALRVVSGTAGSGGSVGFTTAFAAGLSSNATTLSITQIPSHTHTYGMPNYMAYYGGNNSGSNQTFSYVDSGATGGGGSHTHALPSFDVAYVDLIIAVKN